MPKINHHRSSRRVAPPTDSDFDHEIDLVDRDNEDEGSTRPPTAGPSLSQNDGAAPSAADPLEADAEGGPGGGGGSGEEIAAPGQPSVVVVGKYAGVGACVGEDREMVLTDWGQNPRRRLALSDPSR